MANCTSHNLHLMHTTDQLCTICQLIYKSVLNIYGSVFSNLQLKYSWSFLQQIALVIKWCQEYFKISNHNSSILLTTIYTVSIMRS